MKKTFSKFIAIGIIASSILSLNPIEASAIDVIKPTKQWVEVNGQWSYYDVIGNPVKNSWIDNYYLNSEGVRQTGWLYNNMNWYYLGTDGKKQTGWIKDTDGKSYYLNSDGIRQTGWMNDTNGKYYYLNSDGSMAVNTTVNGYQLGADGAWIKDTDNWRKDSTGYWYKDGDSYAIGWRKINYRWYYFYSDGYMAHDTTIDGYSLGSTGAWWDGVEIGMTEDKVLKSSWGKPKDINTITTQYGTHEQWVYRDNNYLYFDNGILTSIQN